MLHYIKIIGKIWNPPLSLLLATAVIKSNFGGSVMEKIPGLYARLQHDVLEAGKTHAQIAEELQARYPGERGFSARSVRRFCSNHGITSSSGLSDRHLDKVVASGIAKVCQRTCG